MAKLLDTTPKRRRGTLFKRVAVAAWAAITALHSLAPAACQAETDVRNAIVYEVNLRAFSEAGDLNGVTARLDEMQELGVNMLWLMPITPVGAERRIPPMGSPYAVQNYDQVGAEYGDLQDLRALVAGAHSRGMTVMLDWVANHTAWDNPWIANPSWYTQSGGQIVHPAGTNWLDVADLNYSNTAMRSAMIQSLQGWVQNVDIDGFRFDTADFVPFDFWQEAIPAVRNAANRPLLMLAEGARADHYAAGFDATYDWDFYNATKSVFGGTAPATRLGATHAATLGSAPAGKSVLRFTTNHDENAFDATPIELFGGLEGSLAAYAATLAYGGMPLVYTGQEIGWTEEIPIFSRDPVDWSTGAATRSWYEQMLGVYSYRAALRQGTLTDSSNHDIVFVRRELDGEQVFMAVNTRAVNRSVEVPVSWQGVWFDQFTGRGSRLNSTLELAPYEVLVLSNDRTPIDGAYNGDSFFLGPGAVRGEYRKEGLVGQDRLVAGWQGPWRDGSGASALRVTDAGLKYPSMQVAGGAVEFGPSQSGRVGRDLTTPVDDATGETLYVSFLMQADGAAVDFGGLELFDEKSLEDAHRVLRVGVDGNNGGNYAVRLFDADAQADAQAADLGANNGGVNLIVLRFNLSATPGGDSLTVWRNPVLRAEPTSGGFTATDLDLSFTTTAFSRSGGDGVLRLDELRMGPTYASVISQFQFTLAGDFNGDGAVDAADYVVWRDGLGGLFSEADFATWTANYGAAATVATTSASSVVPEPPSIALLLLSQLYGFLRTGSLR